MPQTDEPPEKKSRIEPRDPSPIRREDSDSPPPKRKLVKKAQHPAKNSEARDPSPIDSPPRGRASQKPPNKSHAPRDPSPIERSNSPPRKRKLPGGSAPSRNLFAQRREPSPVREASQSPPRKRKLPGAASRISAADREAAQKQALEREKQENLAAQNAAAARGVHDVVRQHYNMVPQRGREWRKTDSKIKGLRSLNNWVKSALIQKFSPSEDFLPASRRVPGAVYQSNREGLKVLDIGCGKGGDLQKWNAAPQRVDLYVGMDPADVSIRQARERVASMGGRRGPRGRPPPRQLFHAEFFTRDCFGRWIGDECPQIMKQVGFDMNLGMDGRGATMRWDNSGFDVVSMMFCMHYAFEDEFKARTMLRNVAGSLKKGGRFLGVIPNSDVLTAKVEEHHMANGTSTAKPKDSNGAPFDYDSDDDWDPEKSLDVPDEEPAVENGNKDSSPAEEDGEIADAGFQWGNDIYRVRFPGKTPSDGIFRPPFGWKYFYFLEEAVEEVPEYVVPWEAFRALALEFNLELEYRKPFNEVWEEEKDGEELGRLSERMGVRAEGRGRLLVKDEEMECASFYHAFCFYKTGP